MKILFMYMYIMSIFSLLLVRKHIFLCLLSLEYVVLSLLMMYSYYYIYTSSFYMLIIMMVFFVCEGVLGLSVLVSLIRCHGNDFIMTLSMW
uniref:NADH dehydrogenase subunit 4L n=1 Tax=Nesophrosyne sp. 281 GMB-2012 TaxID=2974348 RepID=UPI002181F894|nr:NADH dehydrogenase subunit 4L [Nesophrosyne sp. 281 GMB-2012]UVI59682.1 NADH dehydrogenase subunit 4L [Nesophrosyne sp. 281 GMB-2012]